MAYKPTREQRQRYNKRYRLRHPDANKASAIKWRSNNPRKKEDPDKVRQRKKRWRARNKEKYAAEKRRWRLKRKYKLTDFDRLISAQNHRCSGCQADLLEMPSKHVHVDHCHSTGAVRGILCRQCNVTLGHAYENIQRLRGLADYLERHRTTHSPSVARAEPKARPVLGGESETRPGNEPSHKTRR